MNNYLSILFVRPNPVWEEKISVGLFGFSGSHIRFRWSESKLAIAKRWLPDQVYISLRKTIRNIQGEIKRLEKTGSNPELFKSSIQDVSYFTYLSKYNNGLLGFEEPAPVAEPDMITSDAKFGELFRLYIQETKNEAEKKSPFRRLVNKRLKSEKISERANTNYKLDNDIISTIYRPHYIDLISVNGSILAGKAIDFSNTPETIEAGLYEFRVVVEGLVRFTMNNESFGRKGRFLVWHSEPGGKKQESILRNALNDSTKPFELRAWQTIDEIGETLERGNYRKFSEKIAVTAKN